MQAAAETTASGSTGKEDLKADRRVRHYKEVGLQEWPLAGQATVPGVLYGIGLCMSLRRRTILSKRLRAPGPVNLTTHTFRAVEKPQVVVLPLSHGSERGENLATTSPRMPHKLGEIFSHVQLLDFKNRNTWAGCG